MKTRAEELGITDFPYIERDVNSNKIYSEYSDGDWFKYKYDDKGYVIYQENSTGKWFKYKFDNSGNQIYYKKSDGDWWRKKFNNRGIIFYEDHDGNYWHIGLNFACPYLEFTYST